MAAVWFTLALALLGGWLSVQPRWVEAHAWLKPTLLIGGIVSLLVSLFAWLKSKLTPNEPVESESALCFGQSTHVQFPNTTGLEAWAVQICNPERRYDRKFHGVKADLTFTRTMPEETLKKPGWLTWLKSGTLVDVRQSSVSLDSRQNSSVWLILYIRSHLEDKGTYWYAGPDLDNSVLVETTMLTNKGHQLTFGEWQLKISVTYDGDKGKRLERTEFVQAS